MLKLGTFIAEMWVRISKSYQPEKTGSTCHMEDNNMIMTWAIIASVRDADGSGNVMMRAMQSNLHDEWCDHMTMLIL